MNEKDEQKISAVGWVKESCILLDVVQANWLRKMAYKFKRQAGKLTLHHAYEYGSAKERTSRQTTAKGKHQHVEGS